MSWSSSPPVSSCGGSASAATAAARTSWKANDATDRAAGPDVARPIASASRSRSAVAVWRDGVSTRIASGSTPRSTSAATRATSVDVLPVPGAPTTTPPASGRQVDDRALSLVQRDRRAGSSPRHHDLDASARRPTAIVRRQREPTRPEASSPVS